MESIFQWHIALFKETWGELCRNEFGFGDILLCLAKTFKTLETADIYKTRLKHTQKYSSRRLSEEETDSAGFYSIFFLRRNSDTKHKTRSGHNKFPQNSQAIYYVLEDSLFFNFSNFGNFKAITEIEIFHWNCRLNEIINSSYKFSCNFQVRNRKSVNANGVWNIIYYFVVYLGACLRGREGKIA